MIVQPTGTVTFLFTDIQGSTRLWERCPDAMQEALHRHDDIVRQTVEAHDGYVFKTVGDEFCTAFATAPDALNAALAAQRALRDEAWGEAVITVRMALHTGAAEERDGDYCGQPVNRVARLLSAGHGGQILLSSATQELVRDHVPEDVELRDMGAHRLRGCLKRFPLFWMMSKKHAFEKPSRKIFDEKDRSLHGVSIA